MTTKALTSDPRLTQAEASIDLGIAALGHVSDERAKFVLAEALKALGAMHAVLRDWEAKANGWPLPSATPGA
ncbi:hypothetical protein ACSFBX_00015 [Variovorax sp. RB2P76]|uniref:hypothetical protein n=1 Tax=Variovorax sp. RB2P76 TaxID=3443736 RepID=UPI003F44F529